MRQRAILLVVAATILALSAGPAFAYCQFECRLASSGEATCALGPLMVDCEVVTNCELHCDCATCQCYWLCNDHCEGERCLRA